MSIETQLRMAETHGGRIALHLMALVTDHKLTWHFKGILREFNRYRNCGIRT